MLVHIHPELFTKEELFRKLDYIFYFFEDNKHQLIILDDKEVDVILDSQWLERQTDDIQGTLVLFVEKAFQNLVNSSLTRKELESSFQINETNLSSNQAKHYLEQQLLIIIENKENDHYFLDALIKNFRNKGKKLRKAKTENWIDYTHGGGKNDMTKILPSFFVDKPFPPRLFILADSDKYYQAHEVSNTKVLTDKCDELDVDYHILNKREVENYLPVETLKYIRDSVEQAIKDNTTREEQQNNHVFIQQLLQGKANNISSYDGMSSIQKDFYDLEKGFKGNKGDLKNYNTLFDELDDASFNKLKFGFQIEADYFSDKKSRDFVKKLDFKIKDELCKLFQHESINRKNLKERCKDQDNPNELELILEKITALL